MLKKVERVTPVGWRNSMNNVLLRVQRYLHGDAQTMQIATAKDNKPWIATVYFIADDDLNLYWLSWPERRHSRELTENQYVAATIVIKADKPVIGVQLAGEANEISDPAIAESVMKMYVAKYGQGKDFYTAFLAGTNKHHLYCLQPQTVQLFDELNYPDESPLLLLS